jgi:virulence-associated protein VagC
MVAKARLRLHGGTKALRAKLLMNGRSQAVRLPKELRFEGDEVWARKQGDAVILEPIARRCWPVGYWERVSRSGKDLELGRIRPIGAELARTT